MTRRHLDDMIQNTAAVTLSIFSFLVISIIFEAPLWFVGVLLAFWAAIGGCLVVAVVQYIRMLEDKVRRLTQPDDTFVN